MNEKRLSEIFTLSYSDNSLLPQARKQFSLHYGIVFILELREFYA